MTTDQEAEDVAASVRHLMTQRGKDAENWRRQANDWEARCKELREQVDGLTEVLRERTAGYMEQIQALTLALDEQAHDISSLRATISDLRTQRLRLERKGAAIDQAISNLRGMKALNDNTFIEEMIDATADLLGARVSSPDAEQV